MSEKRNPWEKDGTLNNTNKAMLKGGTLTDIDLRRLLYAWPFILLFGILGFGFGKTFTKYIVENHTVSTKVNIQEKDEISMQQAVVGTSRDPFNDRISYLKSPAIASIVADSLDLSYNAILKGTFKDKSLYNIVKWRVIGGVGQIKNDFTFSILPENGRLSLVYLSTKYNNFTFGKPYMLGENLVVVDTLKTFSFNSPIICKYINKWSIANAISSSLVIVAGKDNDIIDITYTDVSTDKGIDILNMLVKLYNETLINDKSIAYSQAINFINKRFQPLSNELDSIENNLSNYQSERGYVGESSNGSILLSEIKDAESRLIDVEVQKSNIDSIESFIKRSGKDLNFAITGISDISLNNNLALLAQLRSEKEKMSTITTPNHPDYLMLEKNIQNLVSIIKQQFQEYKKGIESSRKICLEKVKDLSQQIKGTPSSEKGLVDIKRMRDIKQALFLTLIQKREESAIAKASTFVNTKVLSPPSIVATKEKVSKSMIISLTTLIGMLLPILFFVLKDVLNNKVISRKQLENYLTIPVIGEFEFVEKMEEDLNFFSKEAGRSLFGEQLRALRTQLSFYKKESKPHFIMVTSNMSGEGKSFVSLNLAKSFALQNKKVALLELDLRRPKLTKLLRVQKVDGLSNYLSSGIDINQIIKKPFEEHQNLHFFPAGPIPPNPQELLSDSKIEELQDFLQNNYEVIVIDTPPFGIVADAQIIGKIVDTTLVITRFSFTLKDQIVQIEKWNEKQIFPSMSVIFNGLRTTGYHGYRYGYYYYQRKYGYDYYTKQD